MCDASSVSVSLEAPRRKYASLHDLLAATLGSAGSLVEVICSSRRQERISHLQTLKGEIRLNPVELLADLPEHFREAAGCDHERLFTMRPLGLDASNSAVDRVGGAEDDPRPDTVLGPSSNRSLRNGQLRGRELGSLPRQCLGRGLHTRCDHPADEY